MKIRQKALTFEDVLLVPSYSEVLPKEVNIHAQLTKDIRLNIPFVSAAMDTVTEYKAAIKMSRLGGIGIIHKNMDIETQAKQVSRVKKSESGIINEPIHLKPYDTIAEANTLMHEYRISGFPVVDDNNQLVGILTNRDLRFEDDNSQKVEALMTKAPLITARHGISLDEAENIFRQNKIEKLPLVHEDGTLAGLITIKD
jgi:IMP dehydrogenase